MKRVRGSMTIEASLIVPFMLIVLMTLILAALLLHDVYVLRSDNGLRADAYVIAGEDTREGQTVYTFIIQPDRGLQVENKLFLDKVETYVVGGSTIQPMGVQVGVDDRRSYELLNPKRFLWLIDLADDATDVWSASRAVKQQIEEIVEAYGKKLTGED